MLQGAWDRWMPVGAAAAVLCCVLGGVCAAVDPDRAGVISGTDQAPPAPAVFLERLERVEQELARLGEPSAISPPRPALLPLVLDARLFSTNVYNTSGVRYLALRLGVYNQGDAPLQLDTDQITLSVDGRSQSMREIPEALKSHVIDVGGRPMTIGETLPLSTIRIPARETRALQLMFAPIDSRSDVPNLVLKYSVQGATVEVDLNGFHRGLLELKMDRIGPGGACALVTIGGRLDSINAKDVAQALTAVVEQGVRRAIVGWLPEAETPPILLLGWLDAIGNPDVAFYSPLPKLPGELSELHLSSLPAGASFEPSEESRVVLHSAIEEGVSAALAAVFPRQPRTVVLEQLTHGHPAVRGAALRHGASRLTAADVPLLESFLGDPSPVVKKAACYALADFDDENARRVLAALVRGPDAALAGSALESLLASRFGANSRAAIPLVKSASALPPGELMKILANHPRPEFQSLLREAARSGDPDSRIVALKAISTTRGPWRRALFEQALKAPEATVRNAAFALLVSRVAGDDVELRHVAIDEALRRLKENRDDESAKSVIYRTRDPRAVPILAEHLKSKTTDRRELIELLGRIGGSAALQAIAGSYDSFKSSERAVALGHLWNQKAPEAMRFALADLRSPDADLMERCIEYLTQDASDQSVRALAAALRERKTEDGFSLAGALASINSPLAIDALLEFRDSPRRNLRNYAVSAFRQIWDRSPAMEALANAQTMLNITGPGASDALLQAREYATAAIELDPRLPSAYSTRGNVLLRQEEWEAAVRDCQAALELNPDDDVALAGVAIGWVMLGRSEEALEWIEAVGGIYEDREVFAYNAACTYGRALQMAQQQPPSNDRDQQVGRFRERGIEWLEKSIDRGFAQEDHMQADPDLAVFRDTPEFQNLLRRMAAPTD